MKLPEKWQKIVAHSGESMLFSTVLGENENCASYFYPKEDGFYMTIRCGLGGIYYNLDEWKDSNWQVGILDGSYVIAYSREQIPREVVNEWARNKLKVKGY